MKFCSSCSKEVGTAIALNEAAQMVETCVHCGNLIGGAALSKPLAATGTMIGEARTQAMPVIEKKPADVVALPTAKRAAVFAGQPSASVPLTLEETIASLKTRESQLQGERLRILAEQARLAGVNAELKKLGAILATVESKP